MSVSFSPASVFVYHQQKIIPWLGEKLTCDKYEPRGLLTGEICCSLKKIPIFRITQLGSPSKNFGGADKFNQSLSLLVCLGFYQNTDGAGPPKFLYTVPDPPDPPIKHGRQSDRIVPPTIFSFLLTWARSLDTLFPRTAATHFAMLSCYWITGSTLD